ncbi:MAG: hypothetical protein M1830_006745, partial [Pleopsidium flavum]
PGLHWFSREPKEEPPNELLGATQHPVEVPANHKIIELEARTPQELQGSEVIKDDPHVSAYEPAPQSRSLSLTLPCGHDPNHPVELQHNNGQQQEYYGPEPSPLTPPAYSPSRVGRGGNSHTTTSGEVPRESSPMTTPRLSPLTPMQLVSPLACMSPQLNRHVYRDDHRGVRSAEEDGTGAHPPVSAVSEVRQYQRYSWEDER